MSSRRSLLDQLTGVPLAKPCDVPWSAMQGGDRFRRCAECDREVWNLSAMTAREAEIRLLNASAWPCINYRVDESGALVSRDEPRAPSRRFGLGAAAFVASTLVAPLASADPPPPKSQSDKTPQGDKPAPSGKMPQAETPRAQKPGEPARAWNPEDCPQPAAPASAGMNPQPPHPLGGAPPPPRERPPSGTVQIKTARPRDVVIDGVSFHAPATIQLPPGRHEAQLKDGKKTVKRGFTVALDGTFVLDLDR